MLSDDAKFLLDKAFGKCMEEGYLVIATAYSAGAHDIVTLTNAGESEPAKMAGLALGMLEFIGSHPDENDDIPPPSKLPN